MNISKYISVLLTSLFIGLSLHAQESEEELNQKALALFEQEAYEEAFKVYSTLLSISMQNPTYNFRFGACQLFTSQDKEEPLKYLKFATEQPDPPALAYFYYGLGLHLNYRFDKAIEQYETYQPLAGRKEREAALVAHYIEQCRHGKTLVSSFTDISVVNRNVLPRSDFYREYDLSDFGGKIIVKPEDFMSEEDKKRDAKFLMYFQQEANLIYYASYSEKNATGKDLYFIQKLPTGGWSEPKKLSTTINTEFDEDYPFIHPEGNTLYFASKGHNSMGGYDIFKSTRRGDGSWTKPVNMEFAINTPWDDFMFIADLEETTAWFASNRATSNKQVTVYRIGMERIPLDLTLIKGVFEHEASRRVKITVEDMIQNKTVGVYESDRQFGEYLLDLKGSGKYKFLVEAEESDAIHSGVVEVPREKGLKQFRQEMKLVMVDGQEQLQIINHFDDPIEDETLLTADILKRQANLSVNASEDELVRSVELLNDGTDGAAAANSDVPEAEKLALAERAIRTLKAETQELNNKAAALYEEASTKANSTDPATKAEAAIAAELSDIYRREAERRETALERMEGSLASLKSGGLEADAFDAQYNQLAATKNNFHSLQKFESNLESKLEKRLDPTLSEYESKRAEVAELESDLEGIDEEVSYYQQEIEASNDEQIKEELRLQIADAESARPEKKASLERAEVELAALETQKENAEAYLGVSKALLDQAEHQKDTERSPVDPAALNNLQTSLTEQAKNDPALLALIAPKEADEALADNLSESRRSAVNDGGNSGDSQTGAANNGTPSSPSGDQSTSLNDQIKAIEAQESSPEKVDGNYNRHFTSELENAGNAEDPIIAESRKAELYDQWAENIGIRIDSLQEAKRQETNSRKLVQIDDQIKALETEQEAKEELAMASYQNIASLSDAAASGQNGNAVQSEATSTPGTVGGDAPASDAQDGSGNSSEDAPNDALASEGTSVGGIASRNESLPADVVQINESFEAQLIAADASDADPLEAREAQAEIYADWASALTAQLEDLGQRIASTEDRDEKAVLEQQARDVSALRLDVVAKATDLQQATENEESEARISAAQTDLQSQLYEYVENYNASAFQQIENQVNAIPDPAQRTAQSETLHRNWMIALQNEKVKTEARIANTNDPNQRQALEAKLEDLVAQKESVQFTLDSLKAESSDGPSAPASVMVEGSERFEGYEPVTTEAPEVYQQQAAEASELEENFSAQVSTLEAELADTKKKRQRRELQAELDAKQANLNIIQMQSSFYAEASEKLKAVETQVLTMSEGDQLPSAKQAAEAAQLQAEAERATESARIAMEEAQAIRKKKKRLPAVAEATKLQQEATLKRQRADMAKELAEEMQAIENATVAQNFIILPGEEVVLPVTQKRLNPTEIEDVEATSEFITYQNQLQQADSIRSELTQLEQLEARLTEQGRVKMERSASAPIGSESGSEKMQLADAAYADFERADSVSNIIAKLKRNATFIENEANRNLLALPEEAYMNILAYYASEGRPAPQTPVAESDVAQADTASNPLDQSDAFRLNAPVEQDNSRMQVDMDELTQTIFEIEEEPTQSVYSEANPIPVDPPFPSGLMYKVQIGAFRNPIQQDVFKGIAPIVGESTPAGFIRYSAGEFNSFGQADAAKERIRSIGYEDAFVVAYLNGQRITVSQGRSIEAGTPVAAITPQPQAGTQNGTPAAGGGQQRPTSRPELIQQGGLEIQAVENIPGTFFTVQVGVYSKPVTSSDIYNITPLLQENLSNGLYRYTTGKFEDEATALRARDEVRALGVSDAFVTAYRDGTRVTVEQARAQGTTPQANTNPAPATQTPPATPAPATPAERYRLLLGTYAGEVPVDQASQILMLSGEGVDKVSNPDGSSSYYYGTFDSRAAAESRAAELRNRGLNQAAPEKL